MNRTKLLQEIRKMRFEEAYAGWQGGRLRQEEDRVPSRGVGIEAVTLCCSG